MTNLIIKESSLVDNNLQDELDVKLKAEEAKWAPKEDNSDVKAACAEMRARLDEEFPSAKTEGKPSVVKSFVKRTWEEVLDTTITEKVIAAAIILIGCLSIAKFGMTALAVMSLGTADFAVNVAEWAAPKTMSAEATTSFFWQSTSPADQVRRKLKEAHTALSETRAYMAE
jgi:hypothetical protein